MVKSYIVQPKTWQKNGPFVNKLYTECIMYKHLLRGQKKPTKLKFGIFLNQRRFY
jgi:hypothetical protein